jgi:hypothetical protein
MNVSILPSRLEIDVRANLRALVERARALQVFGPTVEFDAAVWDLSEIKPARPAAGSAKAKRLYFTTHQNGMAKSLRGRTPLEPAFGSMLKAIVAMREHARPKDAGDPKALIRASRSLYEQLSNRGYDPADLLSADFERAAKSFEATSTAHTQYMMGNKLQQLAEAINRYNLSKARIVFVNPFKRVDFNYRQVNEEDRAKAAQKMASDDAVDAIITMSLAVRKAGVDRDILFASAAELLMCAPWRINDCLNLLNDCERSEKVIEEGVERERLGIAFHGSKGVKGSIKWIPTAMKDIAERALADIRRITAPSRAVAKFMEDNPGRAWLPDPWCLADPSTQLDSADLQAALGLASISTAKDWAKRNGVAAESRARRCFYRLSDVERALLDMQPRLPPGSPPLSHYLFLVPHNFGREDCAVRMPVVAFLADGSFADFMVGRNPGRSIFQRLDLKDAKGTPYAVRSHQIRHFLNNLAQEGRLAQLDIARWSGRKDVGQNHVYDHTGGVPLARTMRELLKTNAMRGPVADTFEKLPPVEREAFLKSRLATVHMTDIGACIQDWSLAPCPNHGSCAGCGDHLVIKGDAKQRERAERMLEDSEPMVVAAENEMREGTYGAGPWVEHNRKIVDGLRQVIAVHSDETIPDGTPVQLSERRPNRAKPTPASHRVGRDAIDL